MECADVFAEDAWADLFTPDTLNRFRPPRGTEGDPNPVLEVHYRDDEGQQCMALMVIAADGFNDWQTRRLLLRELGGTCAEKGWRVVAMVFASAAWMRRFSEEEYAAHGDRAVASYDDKDEVMVVQGMTLDDRHRLASARIVRDKVGRIRAVQPWKLFPGEDDGARVTSNLIRAAWEGYAAAWLERHARNN